MTVLGFLADIGSMSNRILVMADKIGEMADRIIMHTEELMVTLVNQNGTSSLIISRMERSSAGTFPFS